MLRYGVATVLVKDHNPNFFFETQTTLSPRQARWYEFLTQFSHMKWEYRPGRTNAANPLSCMPGHQLAAIHLLAATTRFQGSKRPAVGERLVDSPAPQQQPTKAAQPATHDKFCGKGMTTQMFRLMDELVQHAPATLASPPASPLLPTEPEPVTEDARATDKSLGALTERIQAGYKLDDWFSDTSNTKLLLHKAGLYWTTAQDSTTVLVVPDADNLRQECMQECHNATYAGHMGITKTQKLAERTFWWPRMKAD